jgi:hypothetical protein
MVKSFALLASLAAAGILATTAAADPSNRNTVTVTLECPSAAYTGVSILQNNALPFQIEGETFVAVAQWISYVDGSGQTVVIRSNPGHGIDRKLVPCTYEYPGFPFLVTGLFLLTGHA